MIFAAVVSCAMIGGCHFGNEINVFAHFEKQNRAERSSAQAARPRYYPPIAASPRLFPATPRTGIASHADLKAFQSREETELNSYGWIDRQAGVARIPIARAMELLAQKKLGLQSNMIAFSAGPSTLELQQQRPAQTNAPTEATQMKSSFA